MCLNLTAAKYILIVCGDKPGIAKCEANEHKIDSVSGYGIMLKVVKNPTYL